MRHTPILPQTTSSLAAASLLRMLSTNVHKSSLPHLSRRLGHQPIDLEIVQTRLDPLACARPILPGHVSPRVPHLHAVGDRAIIRLRAARELPMRRYPPGRRRGWKQA